jgi:hypothetical protein
MKRLFRSPFTGLLLTGMVASIALLIEARLRVSQDVHFLLQFLWVGVVSAALLAFALLPVLKDSAQMMDKGEADDVRIDMIPELLDTDRAWLQSHPDTDLSTQA